MYKKIVEDFFKNSCFDLLFEMSSAEALTAFDLKAVPPVEELKKKYRELAMKNHPDRGGKEEDMKKINAAYEILKTMSPGHSGDPYKVDWGKIDREYRELGMKVKIEIMEKFDHDKICAYLEEHIGVPFKFILLNSFPQVGDRSPSSAGFNGKFIADKNKGDSVFNIYISTQLHDIKHAKPSLSGGAGSKDYSYTLLIVTDGFHNGKKQKFSQSSYQRTNDHGVFGDPNMLYPAKKLKDIKSGKTNLRKFSKRDMFATMRETLGGDTYSGDGNSWAIPLSNGLELTLSRYTWGRNPLWSFNGIWMKRKLEKSLHFSYGETEENAKRLVALIKGARSIGDLHALGQYFDQHIAKWKAERKEDE